MKISVKSTTLAKQQKSCLIIAMSEQGEFTATGKEINKASQQHLTQIFKQGGFSGKLAQTLPLFQVAGGTYSHILLVGTGKTTTVTAAQYRKLMNTAMKALTSTKTTQATCYLTELVVTDKNLTWQVKQIAELATDALYRFDLFKSQKAPAISLKDFIIHLPETKQQKACERAAAEGLAIASGMMLTKNLANLPSNICTPTFLSEQAKELAKAYSSIKTKVLNEKDMHKLGMGALLAVSQGSAEEAQLICIEYTGAGKKQAPVALIGKGITFDTGGSSLKSPESMVGMKYDMCGAATVLGTLKAAAELDLPINIVGIIAAVENMPGGTAYKPEDILTSMSGQTIEVISTDAEGRLVLADALTYCERYKPEVVIDIATLTGAVVVALGFHTTGLVTNHQPLADDLIKAGEESSDRAWQLPMFDEYDEQIKSPFADMANTGGRSAGTITAGCFLARFAKKFHWAHLDVAGTAAMMMGTSDRYATGRPVPMLMQYLINKAK